MTEIRVVKYFFIIFVSVLAIAAPAYAARQIQGTVPKVQPLQPPAVNIAPNLQNNVQYSDPSHAGQFDAAGNVVTQPQSQPGPASPGENPVAAPASAPASPKSWPGGYWLILLVVLMAIVAFIWRLAKSKQNRHET